MSFNLIIVRQPPYQGRHSQEIIEAIMSLALFDIEHKVVFFEEGIHWLHSRQTPKVQKSLEKQMHALPMYGSEEIYFCADHKDVLCPDADFNDTADAVALNDIVQWMRTARHVEVF